MLHLVTDARAEALAQQDSSRRRDFGVAMVIPAHEDDVPEELRDSGREEDEWRRLHGERVKFEPEEARMLARLLLEAADEHDRVRTAQR